MRHWDVIAFSFIGTVSESKMGIMLSLKFSEREWRTLTLFGHLNLSREIILILCRKLIWILRRVVLKEIRFLLVSSCAWEKRLLRRFKLNNDKLNWVWLITKDWLTRVLSEWPGNPCISDNTTCHQHNLCILKDCLSLYSQKCNLHKKVLLLILGTSQKEHSLSRT